jgi:hypothetical protein
MVDGTVPDDTVASEPETVVAVESRSGPQPYKRGSSPSFDTTLTRAPALVNGFFE